MKSARPATDGWYEIKTRHGKGQLKILANKALGLLDQVWKDPLASWTVPARIVPNGDGSTFLMTFFQPLETKFRIASVTKQFTAAAILQLREQGKLSRAVLDDRAFDEAARELDMELSKLKEILEHETGVFTVSPNA